MDNKVEAIGAKLDGIMSVLKRLVPDGAEGTATVAPKPAAAHKATRPVTSETARISPESVAVIPSEEHERLAEEAKLAGNELM